MKVLCIDDNGVSRLISYGVIYTVQCVIEDKYYRLEEILFNPFTGGIAGFDKSRFIPISDISETEMERNYNFKTEPV